MVQSVDGKLLARMLIHASASLNAEKQKINELNVFPVPDGDTGTNMSLTIGTAAAELQKKGPTTVGETTAINASAMLRGARGNSGVILSLIFRGFSKAMKDKESMDGIDLADGLNAGVVAAYKAVMKPAEGTVLTVSRLAGDRAGRAAEENTAFEYVLESAILRAEEALADTINQNPVLKKAGVVDAGGMGFVILLKGMLDELRGIAAPSGEAEPEAKEKADFAAQSLEEITFTFDIVFIVRKNGNPDVDLQPFRDYLNSIGDSLVIGEDDEAFKVHVHTDIPGSALNEAQKYGTLELAKIENMRTQAEDLAAGRQAQSTDDLEAVEAELEGQEAGETDKRYGFVAVAAGDGLAKVFHDLGVDGVISGGQTMNPSTEDILKEIKKTPAEVVYVLPNNKNIIMAAQQCVDLAEGKEIIVLQAKTVPQGISAMIAMDLDAEPGENTAAREEAMGMVTTMEVTYAARTSTFDGQDIQEGDYLALVDNQLFATEKALDAVLDRLAQEAKNRGGEFINIFYGEGVEESGAQGALERFQAACPDAEITLLRGGQPVYHYLISVE